MNVNPATSQALTILVAEDDAALQTLFVALLQRHGHVVECVPDGAGALARLKERSYDVLILDLMMAKTSGFDVLRHLAEHTPHLLRRTIVTSSVVDRDLARIDATPVFAVLRKPFDIAALDEVVTDCARATRAAALVPIDDPFDGAVGRVEIAIPRVKQVLALAGSSDRERVLQAELRRVTGQLGAVLTVAASLQPDRTRARRYERIARMATSIATAKPSPHEH